MTCRVIELGINPLDAGEGEDMKRVYIIAGKPLGMRLLNEGSIFFDETEMGKCQGGELSRIYAISR